MHCYWLIYFVYLSNYNTQTVAAIFLNCREFLNCLRSVGTIVVTSKTSISNSSQHPLFFAVLMYSFGGPPQIFQVQVKILTIQPEFPEYLSISYDYGASNLDKDFHFLYYCWPESLNDGNIFKNLNNSIIVFSCFLSPGIYLFLFGSCKDKC